jgi:hypothetical protein
VASSETRFPDVVDEAIPWADIIEAVKSKTSEELEDV